MAKFLKGIMGFLAGEKLYHAVDGIKAKVNETIAEMEKRVERATVKVIKASILFLMMFVGALFLLIGLSQYLNETVPSLAHGLGTVIVGAVLIVLALFARMMK